MLKRKQQMSVFFGTPFGQDIMKFLIESSNAKRTNTTVKVTKTKYENKRLAQIKSI